MYKQNKNKNRDLYKTVVLGEMSPPHKKREVSRCLVIIVRIPGQGVPTKYFKFVDPEFDRNLLGKRYDVSFVLTRDIRTPSRRNDVISLSSL